MIYFGGITILTSYSFEIVFTALNEIKNIKRQRLQKRQILSRIRYNH